MKNREVILRLRKVGIGNSQIADLLGVSKQYVSRVSRESNLPLRNTRRNGINGMVTIGPASELLNIPHTTLRKWSDEGTMPTLRVNGRKDRMYKLSDLLSFIDSFDTDNIGGYNKSHV